VQKNIILKNINKKEKDDIFRNGWTLAMDYNILAFSGIIFTIIALIDILKSEFSGNNKIVWTLVVLFLNLFGALLYFAIGRNQKVKNQQI